ncbi:hypothetical protein ACVW0J_007752 [Bradyrhizobium sp. i1.7.7]
MKCTSETPTGKCGRISKKTNTRPVVASVRAANDVMPCSRTVSTASFSATPPTAMPVA